ncbi:MULTISPECIES: hypothetical protein [unclassified Coleofasciculus]|uniref:hypothetical protein n=1 Tax=unclassified Coleofasciculus TaxID=2692782 RepID=UPI00187FC549|nr:MULTISPECIES: hypothetical protein [unclassified Coleofasciculus]MBE9128600.1 hypothetical protein [Coleofasciculus sp. LEGE 07081]MBE9150690.1 hypothetical protein [Coleofasciculus sp. LEGE 07092]
MTWTTKHLGFCIEKGFTPTAIKFYEWLLTQMDEGADEIIDLRDFNKWVAAKRGKPHDNRIVRRAVEQLMEAGVIIHAKKFTSFVWKWTVKSIDFLLNPKPKRSQKRSPIPKKQPENPSNAEPGGQAATADLTTALFGVDDQVASNLEQCLTLCEEAGINYEPEAAAEVLAGVDPEDLKKALALFHKRGGHRTTRNPEGWLRKCLERGWWETRQSTSLIDVLLSLKKMMGVE